jgi:hypothetical protein
LPLFFPSPPNSSYLSSSRYSLYNFLFSTLFPFLFFFWKYFSYITLHLLNINLVPFSVHFLHSFNLLILIRLTSHIIVNIRSLVFHIFFISLLLSAFPFLRQSSLSHYSFQRLLFSHLFLKLFYTLSSVLKSDLNFGLSSYTDFLTRFGQAVGILVRRSGHRRRLQHDLRLHSTTQTRRTYSCHERRTNLRSCDVM